MVKINKHAKPAKSLPNGWMVLTTFRKKGFSKGHRDLTYYSPDMQRFRSLVAAKRFIAANTDAEVEEEEEIEKQENKEQEIDEVENVVFVIDSSSDDEAIEKHDDVVIVVDSSSEDDDEKRSK